VTRLGITEADLSAAIDEVMGVAVGIEISGLHERIQIRRLREGDDFYAEGWPTPPIPPEALLAGMTEPRVEPPVNPFLETKPTAQSPPRRRRRLSFREAEKQAGRTVDSVTDHADGSRTYAFGEKAEKADAEPELSRRALFKTRTNPKIKVVP
jgi:hypothetical protein